jgi:hypothetical protein
MIYRVVMLPQAEGDFAGLFLYIAQARQRERQIGQTPFIAR